jgi:hypothetical protein
MEALILNTETETNDVHRIIQYFAIFNFPLTLEEVFYFYSGDLNLEAMALVLGDMRDAGLVLQSGLYYYDMKCSADCIEEREIGAARAQQLLPRARRVGNFISLFPFVKFVGISGSLSKGHAKANADFDFFIITAPNTLWICRTILHLFKKCTFLFGLQHWFCMNYFIDAHHLELEEKNMFTQIELATLIPLNNPNLFTYFLLKNDLSNIHKISLNVPEDSFVKVYEKLFQRVKNKWLQPLNLFLMRLTDNKWRKKWRKKNFPEDEYDLCFKTTENVSKNHPKNYQKRILELIDKH